MVTLTDEIYVYALVYMDKADTPASVTTPSKTVKSPNTGDTTHTDIVFFLMILATLGMIYLRFRRKKNLR